MVSGEVLEGFVQEDDREGDLEDDDPLGAAERGDLKYQLWEKEDKKDRGGEGILIRRQTELEHDQQSGVVPQPQANVSLHGNPNECVAAQYTYW